MIEITEHAIVITYGNGRTYEIPIERAHETDWIDHIARKTWASPSMMIALREALAAARSRARP